MKHFKLERTFFRGFLAFLFVAASFVSLIETAPAQEKKIALIVGNSNYRNVGRLDNPKNDAEDIAATLKDLGFSVTRLLDADLQTLEAGRRTFAEDAKGAGVRLFYYAGHGVQSAGENWLIPVDADVKEDYELKTKAVSAQVVLDGLEAAGPGTNLVILDACRDNPFKASTRSASRGLAVMGIKGSLIAYATAPGQVAQDGNGRNGVFTSALLAEISLPGKSIQELLTSVTARVSDSTGGKQTPYVNSSLPRLFYFITPEEAKARFGFKIAEGEAALRAVTEQLASLKGRLGAESDAARRQTLELEIRKQAALEAQKRQETEALKAEKERQEAAAKAKAEENIQLAGYRAEQAAREETIRKAAEERRRELESLKAGAGGTTAYLIGIETARSAKAEIEKQYSASLAAVTKVVAETYDKKLAALSSWTMDPWENEKEFKARVGAERTRLQSEKQANLAELTAGSGAKKQAALVPFEDTERQTLAELVGSRFVYRGNALKLEIGTFDRDGKFFPITLTSTLPEFPFSASFNYALKSSSTDELRKAYMEFDTWLKAQALFGEAESSVASAGSGAFATLVEAWRIKAVDAAGERVLYEERKARPIAAFTGSADRDRPRTVSSYLLVEAEGAEILVNGVPAGSDRMFLIDPKPGDYSIKAKLADGTALERKRKISEGEAGTLSITTTGTVRVLPLGAGELLVNGALRGKVDPFKPFEIKGLLAGRKHNLELRYPDGKSEKYSVTTKAQDTVEVKFTREYSDPKWALVQGGTYTQGDNSSDGRTNEKPAHQTTVSTFLIAKREITVGEFRQFVQETGYKTTAETNADGQVYAEGKFQKKADASWRNPYYRQDDSSPVTVVSWYDAIEYCNWRSKKEGYKPVYSGKGTSVSCDFTASGYRLPTEAEWEFAAKGGKKSRGYKFAGANEASAAGWFSDNSISGPKSVGLKAANELGIYDMSGNVWEWCWDWFADYTKDNQQDPKGASSGANRSYRGGGWFNPVLYQRSSVRSNDPPGASYATLGFRIVRGLGS